MQLTTHQSQAFERIKAFVRNDHQKVYVLKGYAGTGKTTLVKFLLDWMEEHSEYVPVLLASTGRAAKVLASKAEAEATTVHSHIYSFDVLDEQKPAGLSAEGTGQLTLNFELKSGPVHQKTLYVVDEASMLSHLVNDQNTLTKFGSGNLLLDLFQFAGNNKILFVGDPAQLPPVAGDNPFSPALDAAFLERYFKKTSGEVELKEIMRQREGHSILELATQLRNIVLDQSEPDWESVLSIDAPYIYHHFTGQRMVDAYLRQVGDQWDQAIILTHSNKQAFFLNDIVRKTIFKGEPPHHLQEGELLMVTQNSYYVPLSNGDQVLVRKIKPAGKRAGFFFLEVVLEAVFNRMTYKTLLIHDFLFKPEANLDPEKQRALLIDFDKRAREQGLSRNSIMYKEAMLTDPYLNALRAKFGYVVTCHKAQGGEWPTVFINLSETISLLDRETRFRWLYTAVTRAQNALNLKPIYRPPTNRPFRPR